ncbi:MAG TPA: DUF4190 domain-containing protein [Anaerolineales bacterium]|nr:DUF4190 domain-containing protein [Anaerolineales bacterium]
METPLPPLNESPVVMKNNNLAIAAGWCGLGGLALSLVGLLINFLVPGTVLVCCGIAILGALVGLVLGIIALVQLKNNPGQKGKNMAIVGIVLGAIALVILCISPFLVTAILTLLGPVIGNVFSKINNSLIAP